MYTLGNQSTRLAEWVQQVQKGHYCDICNVVNTRLNRRYDATETEGSHISINRATKKIPTLGWNQIIQEGH